MQKEYYSYDQLKDDMKNYAQKLQPYNFEMIIPITRGGLVPACYLGYLLDIRNFQTLCLSSYDGKKQNQLQVIDTPQIENVSKEKILIVDSMVDKGTTLAKTREILGQEVKIFTIYLKPHAIQMPDFYIHTTTNWVVFPWEYDN